MPAVPADPARAAPRAGPAAPARRERPLVGTQPRCAAPRRWSQRGALPCLGGRGPRLEQQLPEKTLRNAAE